MRNLFYFTIAMLVLAFFLLRPYHLQSTGLMYSGDDQAYMAHATALAFGNFPSYAQENFYEQSYMSQPKHSVGPGIMAVPFVFVGSLVDRFMGSPVVQKRTRQLLNESWMLFGFMLATLFYFYVGFVLLYQGLCFHFEEHIAFLSVFCLVFLELFGLYLFRRPIISHIYEFFLQSVCVYMLLKDAATPFLIKPSTKVLAGVGVTIGLMMLVRYNNVPMALTWPVVLLCMRKPWFSWGRLRSLGIVYGIAGLLVVVFKIWPMIYNHAHEAYANETMTNLLAFDPLRYLAKLWYVVCGIDFGILFTAPFALIGLMGIAVLKGEFRKKIVLLLMPLCVNLYLILAWGNKGDWYGYRYILFSLIPLVALPFAELVKRSSVRFGMKFVVVFLGLTAIMPLLSMFSFEGNSTTLTLNMSTGMWANAHYQLEVWKTLVLHPIQYAVVLFKGCPLYAAYVCAHIAHLDSRLPAVVLEKYPLFNSIILIKVVIIFTFPLCLYAVIRRIVRHE